MKRGGIGWGREFWLDGLKGEGRGRGGVRLSGLSSKTTLASDEARMGSEGRSMRNWFLPQEQEPRRGGVGRSTVESITLVPMAVPAFLLLLFS